jgi:arylsulfatase A-like enzyme
MIKPGSQSDELLCLVDMLATCAAIDGQTLPPQTGPDSFNMLPALLGEKHHQPLRDHLVMQANGSRTLAVRKGPWKLLPGPQLYNLSADPGETNNLAAQHPEVVRDLSELLDQIRERGRSRP